MEEEGRKEERRRSARVKFRASVRYQIRGRPEFSNAVVEDIGRGGIGFIVDRFIAPSNNIALQINVLSRCLCPIGRVTRSEPLPRSDRYHLGIEFFEFEPSEKKYLENYLDMQLGKI